MLLDAATLDGIVRGDVTCVFRRWKRAGVRAGTRQRTPRGIVVVEAITAIDPATISDADARRAGYPDAAAVRAALPDREDATTYRIDLRFGGADPRLALREDADLDDDALADLRARLARLDARSPRGPWTWQLLDVLAEQPHVRAEDLAATWGWEKAPFKRSVRRLKELGLTISHSPGYELSPRGRALRDAGPG